MSSYEDALRLIDQGQYREATAALSDCFEASELEARQILAGLLFGGNGVEQKQAVALEIWTRLAKGGDTHSQVALGSILVRHPEEKIALEGLRWLEEAGRQGSTKALAHIAQIYYGGFGPIQADPSRCIEYMQKASDLNDVEAIFTLAHYYSIGFGVKQSDEKYIELNNKAIELGDPRGHYNLGVAYEHGFYGLSGDEEAFNHYQIAAEAGVTNAQHNLGARYFNGKGVEKDIAKAIFWYMSAAANGSTLSQHSLGLCYFEGTGVVKNDVVGLSWFFMAHENGHDKSKQHIQYLLGSLSEIQIAEARELAKSFAERQQDAVRRAS